MRYVSTRCSATASDSLTFSEAVLAGLAPDGGLFVPVQLPTLPHNWRSWRSLSFAAIAARLLSLFVDESDIPHADLERLAESSFIAFDSADVTPLRKIPIDGSSPPLYMLELWHGPTFAFKDVALQLLGNLFEYLLNRSGQRIAVLGATSGDTGSAAIYGLRGKRNINVCILYPRGRVSKVQEAQMTTILDANVCNVAIEGTFDDCQDLVKKIFSDSSLRDEFNLAAVNSINIARIIAQITYYFAAYFQLLRTNPTSDSDELKITFSVPSGNFGDVLAGYYAQQMGLSIHSLVVATNKNDILCRFLHTGVYESRSAVPTLSPAMDISVASNFERVLHMWCNRDGQQIVTWMNQLATHGKFTVDQDILNLAQGSFQSVSVNDKDIMDAIQRYYTQYTYLLDPHTAVGVVAAERIRQQYPLSSLSRQVTICLATAHPGKFSEAVLQAIPNLTEAEILPDAFKGLLDKPRRVANIGTPSIDKVVDVLRHNFAALNSTQSRTIQ